MIYTVRYAHLEEIPKKKKGDFIHSGDLIGIMGETGKCYGAHLHIDCVEGFIPVPWRLSQMESGEVTPNFTQLNYFIDEALFRGKYKVTSHIFDHKYKEKFKKNHPAYDVIPLEGKFKIYWNRSKNGTVLSTGYDPGYGNYIHIGFTI
ncbi:MAG: M23 family metallopeptidase [Draconibacterium sp.]|nr:M23 family metallopeptidase [Draconibacterium sp.]